MEEESLSDRQREEYVAVFQMIIVLILLFTGLIVFLGFISLLISLFLCGIFALLALDAKRRLAQ